MNSILKNMEEFDKTKFLSHFNQKGSRRHRAALISCALMLLSTLGLPVAAAGDKSLALEMYALYDTKPAGGRLIDEAPLYPKLGYASKDPLFRISQIREIYSASTPWQRLNDDFSVAKSGVSEDLTIYLYEDDAKAWNKLWGKFSGKRIAFLLDNEVLAAPKLTPPGASAVPNVTIRFAFSTKAERLKWTERLEKLKRKRE